MPNPYMTPEQSRRFSAQTAKPATPAPAAPAQPPPVPPNPLAGIDYAIGKQNASKPAQPVSFNGGAQHYNPTTAPFGFDQTMPGVYEQLFANNQNLWLQSPQQDWVMDQLPQFQDPWSGEQEIANSFGDKGSNYGAEHWEGIRGAGNTAVEDKLAAGYRGPNNAQAAFDMTKSRIPQSFQPQFDAYYDRMKDKVMSDVNSQSAARGAYGSNTALNNTIGAGLDVEAQRAKALTDFMFKDSENQRSWLDSLGTQGRSADLTGLDIFGANENAARYGLDKTKTLSDIAFKADDYDLERDKFELDRSKTADELKRERLDSGISTATRSEELRQQQLRNLFTAARDAQNAQEGRVGNLEDDLGDFENDVMGFLTDNFDALLGGDQQLSEQELQTLIAQTADQRGWDQQTQDRVARDTQMFLDFITGMAQKKATGGTG